MIVVWTFFEMLLNGVFFCVNHMHSLVSLKCRKKLRRKFPGNTALSTTDICNLLKKLGLLGQFWTKAVFKKPCAYKKKCAKL